MIVPCLCVCVCVCVCVRRLFEIFLPLLWNGTLAEHFISDLKGIILLWYAALRYGCGYDKLSDHTLLTRTRSGQNAKKKEKEL